MDWLKRHQRGDDLEVPLPARAEVSLPWPTGVSPEATGAAAAFLDETGLNVCCAGIWHRPDGRQISLPACSSLLPARAIACPQLWPLPRFQLEGPRSLWAFLWWCTEGSSGGPRTGTRFTPLLCAGDTFRPLRPQADWPQGCDVEGVWRTLRSAPEPDIVVLRTTIDASPEWDSPTLFDMHWILNLRTETYTQSEPEPPVAAELPALRVVTFSDTQRGGPAEVLVSTRGQHVPARHYVRSAPHIVGLYHGDGLLKAWWWSTPS